FNTNPEKRVAIITGEGKAKEMLKSKGIDIYNIKERGVDDAVLLETPNGIPFILYYDMEYVDDVRMKFYMHRGARPVRLAHVNYMVKDLIEEYEFLNEVFGFYETEEFRDERGERSVIWLTKSGTSHEIAIARSERNVPGFHHETYYVHDVVDIIRVADILASAGLWDNIERGPGRHGATEGYYIYVRDFDKNRIEFFSQDYVILDPDKWKPVVWSYEQMRYRSDFWGRPIPESWLREWQPVEDHKTGKIKGW
ncbi:MAG: VOC family protein, partial [Sulfolobus sp.]|nr:VOC family protein [Sulfolobus sp.]